MFQLKQAVSHTFKCFICLTLFVLVLPISFAQSLPLVDGPDFSNLDLTDMNFSGQDLFCADFSNSILINADFSEANVSAANFQSAVLINANFTGANLYGADLTGAELTGALWDNTVCPNGNSAFASSFEPNIPTSCEPPYIPGEADELPDEYPPITGVIGGTETAGSPVDFFAVWDNCPGLITPGDAYPYTPACIDPYTDAGLIYLTYHPISWVEVGPTGFDGILAEYPDLAVDGYWMDFDGNINPRGETDPVPTFSNASDTWLDFMINTIKTQVDNGVTGIGFDEGWGTLGPGMPNDFSPAAMEGFRQYLENRYNPGELVEKGVDDIATFNWKEAIMEQEVMVRTDFDPGSPLRPEWWEEQLGRPLEPGETYSWETIQLAVGYASQLDPLLGMINPEQGDYSYYNRMRLREIYETLQTEIKPYAEALGQPWYLSANVFNGLDWGNAAVGAVVLDMPMGELSYREAMWPEKNFTSFYKNMAAIGKRFNAMFWPGQVLEPSNDNDTESVLVFVADAHVSGGVSQHPGPEYNDMINPFYELIQAHEDFFVETDNDVALYYSLGNHMGDVGRPGVEVWTYYGAARLLEDSHISYDVLYQGSPDMGPGTVQWVEQDVTLEDLQDYELIVLPNTQYMSETEIENFLSFVEDGGSLVVFGAAGTNDFSFPDTNPIDNPIWSALVSGEGVHTLGFGAVYVFPEMDGSNVARNYDDSLNEEYLSDFQAGLNNVFIPGILTDFSKDVHFYRYCIDEDNTEIIHFVNFDYDAATDTVTETTNNLIAFSKDDEIETPVVTYYTPDQPEGINLPLEENPPMDVDPEDVEELILVTIPNLHVYGMLVVSEEPPTEVLNWEQY